MVNDYKAQALSLPYLSESGLKTVSPGSSNPNGHKLVVGAGTGLGVGMLIKSPENWIPIEGEGGHVSLPVESQREFDVLTALARDIGRVSAERVLSGPGLVSLHNTLCLINGSSQSVGCSSDVITAGKEDEPIALETLSLFSKWLGQVVGDLALSIIPRGGIYITGGLTPVILNTFGHNGFVEHLRAKGRVAHTLVDIPIHIVTDPHVGLIGAAASSL